MVDNNFPIDEPPMTKGNYEESTSKDETDTQPSFRTEELSQDSIDSPQERQSLKKGATENKIHAAVDTKISTSDLSSGSSSAVTASRQEQDKPSMGKTISNSEKRANEQAASPVRKGFPKAIILVVLFLIIGIVVFFVVRSRLSNLSETLFGKKGEIVWWGFRDDGGIYKTLIDEYQKTHPNLTITYQRRSPTDYRERLTNALASGEGPDIFEIHNSWIPMFISDIEPSPMSKSEFSNSFYPILVSDLTSGDSVLAAPLELDALTLFVNEDVFASAAKIPPTTWDELRSVAIELTQKDDNNEIIQSGIALGLTENVDHWQEILALMMLQNGVNFSKEFDSKVEDAINFYISFNREHRVWDSKLPSSTNAFALGKTAMYLAPSWRAYEIIQINPNLKFRTEVLPQLPKNQPDEPDFSYASYWVQAVWMKSANKDIAWDFLTFLMREENLKKINSNNKQLKGVERLYPRPGMNINYRDHPILGSVMRLAYNARSWYLADATNDGENGINTQLAKVFVDAMQAKTILLPKLDSSVKKILSQYLQQR